MLKILLLLALISDKPKHCQKWKHFSAWVIRKRYDSLFFISFRKMVTTYFKLALSIIMRNFIFLISTCDWLISKFVSKFYLGGLGSCSRTVKIQAMKTFSYHGHASVTLYVQFLCSDWSKFGRWVHADNLCSILKLVYFESWSWQSFLSTCDVFNCLFQWMYKMKYSCYQESSVIYGWFVYWLFGWEMRRLSKSEIRFRMASFSQFHLEGSKVSSDSGLTW